MAQMIWLFWILFQMNEVNQPQIFIICNYCISSNVYTGRWISAVGTREPELVICYFERMGINYGGSIKFWMVL